MTTRQIAFSGRRWLVKSSREPIGPEPNLWSDAAEHVHVDEAGRLHLRAAKEGGRWWCAEVVSEESWGHGLTSWVVKTPAAVLGDTGVLGLFTWDDGPAHAHRELDVESSTGNPLRWSAGSTDSSRQPGG